MRTLPAADAVVILLPVFNDWRALAELLPRLAGELSRASVPARVLVVDDGSTDACPASELPLPEPLAEIRVLRLRRNLGHQRAIAVGLAYAHRSFPGAGVVVMDADGEDLPSDVPRLLASAATAPAPALVFAERRRRSEGPVFRLLYFLYRVTHRLLTGIPVRIGNFSYVSSGALERLVVVSELWNHYAAGVVKARLPHSLVPTQRGQRLAGESHMNVTSLVVHGLSAISVFGDVVGVRLLAGVGLVMGAAIVAALMLTQHGSGASWVGYAALAMIVLTFQTLVLALFLAFVVLSARQSLSFVPLRDYELFIAAVETRP